MRRNDFWLDLATWCMSIVMTVLTLMLIGCVGVMIYDICGGTESNYEYISTLGYKGYAKRCYNDEFMYCVKEDGTEIQVIQYKDLGEE